MTPQEILRAAAELVERPGAWTQRELARGPDGFYADPLSSEAVCFCAVGAMRRVSGTYAGGESEAYTEARLALIREVHFFPGGWNDVFGRTAAEVAEAMRRTAASLDAAEHDPACVRLCCVTTPRDDGGEA